jgi:beta-lactamase regulating signal transducer with metallopeptidase domain
MLDVLARAAAGGAIFATIVWVLVRCVPRLSPTTKALLWWMAAVKFVIALSWSTPVLIRVLPPADPLTGFIDARLSNDPNDIPSANSTQAASTGPDWPLLLIGLWAAGVTISCSVAFRRCAQRREVLRASLPADVAVQRTAREIALILGVRRVPEVRITPATQSPFITGMLHPVISVPPRIIEMPVEQLRMALCHELAHVRRGDLWLGVVPALAERIFFFHPLARIAAREHAFWREVACDAIVLETLATPPQTYGRLLLALGVASERATLAPAGAAWSFSSLKRRIVMLQHPPRTRVLVRVAAASVVALALVGMVPFHLAAREAAMVPAQSSPVALTSAQVGPQLHAGGLLTWLTHRADEASAEPVQSRSSRDREVHFVYMHDGATTMSGSAEDVARARRLRNGNEDLLWFLSDGKEYVVRDRDLLKELHAIWQPVSAIGDEQGKIGSEQAEIGVRQGEIGARQAKIGAEQAEIGARQAEIGARQSALAVRQARRPTDAERAEIDRQMRILDDDMRKLDQEMRALDQQMRALDAPMGDLGDDMDALGRKMDALGRKMDEAQRKAEGEMRALFDRAIASGAAQSVR